MGTLSVKNISYIVGKGNVILDNISFEAMPFDRIAILGSNGSGKTSLLEVILGIVKATMGTVSIDGQPLGSLKSEYGVVWDNVDVFPWLKVREVLRYFAAIRGVEIAGSPVFTILGMGHIMDNMMKNLSKGEKKKVAIAIALIHNPKYLFLDEFSADLDEATLMSLWQNNLQYGKTILFSTHNWAEAERYASKFLFMHKGKLLMRPKTKMEIFEDYPFLYKVVIEDGAESPCFPDIPCYKSDGQLCFLTREMNSELLGKVQGLTHNYSVVKTELPDIYNYLISTI